MRRAKRICSLTRLREGASSNSQDRTSTQSVTNARKSKDPLFSSQRSNVGTLSRISVMKAPLVPTWCLHASSKAARSSWPNRYRSCCYVCWRQRIGPNHGSNIGLSPSTRRKPFFQPATTEVSTWLHTCRRSQNACCSQRSKHTHQPHSLLLDQISSPTRKVEVPGTRWPIS